MAFFRESGFYWGRGFSTVTLGLVLVAVGIDASAAADDPVPGGSAQGASVSAILVAIIWALRTFVSPIPRILGPDDGIYAIVIGGLVGAIASPSLREGQTSVS